MKEKKYKKQPSTFLVILVKSPNTKCQLTTHNISACSISCEKYADDYAAINMMQMLLMLIS